MDSRLEDGESWRTAAKKPVLNQDLWLILDQLNTPAIQWQYTQGHAGDSDNERCDQIAQAFARRGDALPKQRLTRPPKSKGLTMLYSLLFALVFAGSASTQESTRFQSVPAELPTYQVLRTNEGDPSRWPLRRGGLAARRAHCLCNALE